MSHLYRKGHCIYCGCRPGTLMGELPTCPGKKSGFLGIKAICEKLGISRSSFGRLRLGTLPARIRRELAPFPQPTLTIGRSPLWSTDSLNKWINQ